VLETSDVWLMVFNATFNNMSVISWQSVSLVKETGVPGENHWPVASHWQSLSHNVVSSTPRYERDSNPQLRWWYYLIAQVVVNPTTIRSWSRLSLSSEVNIKKAEENSRSSDFDTLIHIYTILNVSFLKLVLYIFY
jgi:hypothetical protein